MINHVNIHYYYLDPLLEAYFELFSRDRFKHSFACIWVNNTTHSEKENKYKKIFTLHFLWRIHLFSDGSPDISRGGTPITVHIIHVDSPRQLRQKQSTSLVVYAASDTVLPTFQNKNSMVV